MPSATMLTAISPISGMGWRTVVNAGVSRLECAMSSKPITETCSGTLMPQLVNARIAPKAVMSSNAIKAVNWRFLRTSSFVRLQAGFKTGERVPRSGQVEHKICINLQAVGLGKISNAVPSWPGDGDVPRASQKRDLAMPQ